MSLRTSLKKRLPPEIRAERRRAKLARTGQEKHTWSFQAGALMSYLAQTMAKRVEHLHQMA
jgi:hypothetical protein